MSGWASYFYRSRFEPFCLCSSSIGWPQCLMATYYYKELGNSQVMLSLVLNHSRTQIMQECFCMKELNIWTVRAGKIKRNKEILSKRDSTMRFSTCSFSSIEPIRVEILRFFLLFGFCWVIGIRVRIVEINQRGLNQNVNNLASWLRAQLINKE